MLFTLVDRKSKLPDLKSKLANYLERAEVIQSKIRESCCFFVYDVMITIAILSIHTLKTMHSNARSLDVVCIDLLVQLFLLPLFITNNNRVHER